MSALHRTIRTLTCRARRGRGQGGFIVIAGLAVWMLVGGVLMLALLDMTMSSTQQAIAQHRRAQQTRAVDGAMETAVAQIQIDPSGRIGQPTGKDDGSCEAGLANGGDDLVIDDTMGTTVVVTATCWGASKKGQLHQVELAAEIDGGGPVRGSAVLDVVKAKGPGNNVTVSSWDVGADPTGDGAAPTTTSPAGTTSSTVATTTTAPSSTTTTIGTSSGVTATLTVTSEWGKGYCVSVDVANTGKSTTKWTVTVPVKGTITSLWNGVYTRSGDTLTVSGVDWNQSLKSGETATFGFCSNY